MKTIMEKILLLIVFYPLGLFLGVLFQLLRLIGRIQVVHGERFPRWQGNLILVANHPSPLEPFLLPLLFFRQYLAHPFQFMPWNTPDKTNFYDPWYCWWLRCRSVPIQRESQDRYRSREALKQMIEILQKGQILILFPEGGRTFKGQEGEFLWSQKGREIRILKEGIGLLVAETRAMVVPVWVEGTDKVLPNDGSLFPKFWKSKIIIKIGKPLRFQENFKKRGINKKEIVQRLAQALLRLADE